MVVFAALGSALTIAGCGGDDSASSGAPTTSDASVDQSLPDASPTTDATVADSAPTADANTCATGKVSCSGACVNTKTDVNNCGACGARCGSPLVCASGVCSVDCGDAGAILCGSSCAEVASDPDNCGTCGTKCTTGQACVSGACKIQCTGGTQLCGTSCVDTKVDPTNCGACGATCPSGTICSAGSCTVTCTGGLVACDADAGADAAAFCANTRTDNANCGGCGVVCGAGLVCSNGSCQPTCGANLILCSGTCINPKSDTTFCGASLGCGGDAGTAGTTCSTGQSCVSGVCAVVCPGHEIDCGGACIDPTSSAQHCGATGACGAGGSGSAGVACAAGQVCAGSACVSSCPQGEIACQGGCIDPTSNNTFCGASGTCTGATQGTTCPAGDVCSSGHCLVSCQNGLLNCNGTCVDPKSDRTFCGASGNCEGTEEGTTCDPGFVCSNGQCQISCQGTLIDCGNSCIDPQTNGTFCGASGDCSAAGGRSGHVCTGGEVCLNGACGVSCPGAEVLCQGACIDPQTDNFHCGASNPCEADGGTGGVVCSAGLTCSGGQCKLICPGSQVACNGVCIDPTTDNTFCGATAGCGVSGGSAGATCNTSTGELCQGASAATARCVQQCPVGELSCAGDGGVAACVDPQTDLQFCGATGNCQGPSAGTTCGAGTVCSPSDGGLPTCQATCATPLERCPGSDRCSDLNIDPKNCGTCGHTCGADNTCINARCTQTHVLGPSDLVGLTLTTAFCSDGNYINGPDTCHQLGFQQEEDYGVQWADNGDLRSSPIAIAVTFSQGYSCDNGAPHPLLLNQHVLTGPLVNSSSAPFASSGVCNQCPTTAADTTVVITGSDLNFYLGNTTNSFEIGDVSDPTATIDSCEGLSPITGSTYATVVITY